MTRLPIEKNTLWNEVYDAEWAQRFVVVSVLKSIRNRIVYYGQERSELEMIVRAQELSGGSRGGRPRLPVPNSHFSVCERKATLNVNKLTVEWQVFIDRTMKWRGKAQIRQTQKGSNERLFILTRTHSMQVFGEIPFVKPQNDT